MALNLPFHCDRPGYTLKTIRCRKLTFGRVFGWVVASCRSTASKCDLDLNFVFAVVTLTYQAITFINLVWAILETVRL